jgi:hypothetical protein
LLGARALAAEEAAVAVEAECWVWYGLTIQSERNVHFPHTTVGPSPMNDRMTKDEVEEIVRSTVAQTLFNLGLDSSAPDSIVELRKDMAHLRKWRNSVEQVQSTTFMVALGIVFTGMMGALWLGLKSMLH